MSHVVSNGEHKQLIAQGFNQRVVKNIFCYHGRVYKKVKYEKEAYFTEKLSALALACFCGITCACPLYCCEATFDKGEYEESFSYAWISKCSPQLCDGRVIKTGYRFDAKHEKKVKADDWKTIGYDLSTQVGRTEFAEKKIRNFTKCLQHSYFTFHYPKSGQSVFFFLPYGWKETMRSFLLTGRLYS